MRSRALLSPVLPWIVALAGCAPAVPSRLAWTPASEIQTLSTSGKAASSPGDQEVALAAGALLLIEARPGERVRVTGATRPEDLEIGVAGRDADPAEAITWLPSSPIAGGRTFLMPHWAPSTTVVVRSRIAERLRTEIAEPEVELLAWERFEEDAVEWTRGSRSAPPPAPSEAMAPSLRFLEAMRDALGQRSKTDAGRAWLSLALVQEGLVERPITSLVFPWAPVSVSGGRAIPTSSGPLESPVRTVRCAVLAGADLDIAATQADVVRLELTGGVGPSRVLLSAAGVPVRTLQLAGAARRSSPVRVRLIVPAGGAVRAHVELGEVTIGVDAYRHRSSLIERVALHRRDPSRLAEEAAADEVLGALASAAHARDVASFHALSAAAASAGDRGSEAVLWTFATALAPTPALAMRAARAAFHAAEGLRPATAWPLRRRVVEALLDRRPAMAAAFAEGPGLVAPAGGEGSNEEDRIAVRVALAILDSRTGSIRPEAADVASRFALRDTSRDDWASFARLAWQTEVGWRPLAVAGAPEAQVTWTAPLPEIDALDGLCDTTSGGTPRWTRLAPGVRTLAATVPPGATHAVVPIRGETLQGFAPGALRVDATKVPVHGSIGVPSIVALAAGTHAWTLAQGAPPVLARVPREGQAPCDELRRMDRWFLAPGEVTVDAPPGPVETVARVTLRRAETSAAAPLHLDIGGVRTEVRRLGDEPVVVEAPIRVTGGAVSITPSAPVWLRVEVRARAEVRPPLPLALPTAPDEATLLAAIRAATKAFATAGDDEARAAARRARARALASLGFRRLAQIDVGKIDVGKGDAGKDAPSGDASNGRDAEPADDVLARVLPAAAPAVVPLDVAAMIEELPAPADPSALTKILERVTAGDAADASDRFTGVAEPARPDESTLLRALVAERAQAWEPATRAYGRLALESERPVASARAALAYADLALAKASPDLALTGYLFAKRAQQHGADARAPMGRLDPAVGFARPDTASAAGHTWVERDGQDPRLAASLVERVRRAYLDASADATVLDGDEHIVVRVAPAAEARLAVEHACALLDPAPPGAAACRAVVRIDGKPAACDGAERTCTVAVPKGKRRVEVALEASVERMGWVRLRWSEEAAVRPRGAPRWLATNEAERLQPRSAARWLETDATRPLAMSFAGPTLVRIDARGTPGQPERLDVRVDGASAAALDLDAPLDPSAFRRDLDDAGDRAVRGPQQVEIVVMSAGAHTLEIRSAGRALVSPSFAIARGLPRPVIAAVVTPPLPVVGAPIAPLPPPAPIVGEDKPPGPFTLTALATLVLDNVTDPTVPADDAGRYLEASISARRRFLDGLVFTRIGALARVRTGLPTFGADARVDFDTPVGSPIPKAFLEGSLYGQQGGAAFDVAGGLHTGVWWQLEPLSALSVVPTLGVDLSTAPVASVARYQDLARLDGDVYTRYDAPRPVELFATVMGSYRATMDSIVRLRLGTHVAGIEGVDDVFAYPSIDVSPGRGIAPALSLGYALSYHFASASLSAPYVRHRVDLSAFFWQWIRGSHRVSASASAVLQEGSPFGDDVDLRLIFGLGYDFTAGRGVSDYSPLEMQFRERFDEDGDRVIRRAPRTLEPPPEPPSAP